MHSLKTNVFDLPLEEKMHFVSRDKARRGYSPIDSENFASLANNIAMNDKVEKFPISLKFNQ